MCNDIWEQTSKSKLQSINFYRRIKHKFLQKLQVKVLLFSIYGLSYLFENAFSKFSHQEVKQKFPIKAMSFSWKDL